jgi:flagellar biosynthesis GTPase FlhF
MNELNIIKKEIIKNLSFLDNSYVNFTIVVCLILYSSLLFTNINIAGGILHNNFLVRIIILLLISCLAFKDTNIAILLSIAYLISLRYIDMSEKFELSNMHNEDQQHHEEEHHEEEHHEEEHHEEEQHHEEQENENQQNEDQLQNKMMESNSDIESYINTEREQVYNDQLKNIFKTNENYENQKCNKNIGYTNNSLVTDNCTPVQTFKNELNAQGMNDISGYNLSNIEIGHEI